MQLRDRHIPSKVGDGLKKIIGNIKWLFDERIFSMFINVLAIPFRINQNMVYFSTNADCQLQLKYWTT